MARDAPIVSAAEAGRRGALFHTPPGAGIETPARSASVWLAGHMGKKNRQQSGNSPKVPLLDSEEWLSAQLLRALQTVFQRFDADGDGALNEAELQAFARACNDGTELDADELDQIQDYFDTDDSGALTLRGFHEMYHMQTRSRSAAATAPALTAPALRRRGASPPPSAH